MSSTVHPLQEKQWIEDDKLTEKIHQIKQIKLLGYLIKNSKALFLK